MFEKNNEVKVVYPENLPILENEGVSRKHFFKIKIEKIKEVKSPEVETAYIHKENKKVIREYAFDYEIEKDNQKDYLKIKRETGDVDTKEHSQKIFEQVQDDIEISDIVLYLNRAK